MKLLLDTHSLLWTLDDSRLELSAKEIEVINEPTNIVYVSIASLWEIAIKAGLGKLKIPDSFFRDIPTLGFELLSIGLDHLEAYRSLALLHRDPFDRILIAQAQVEKLTLITHDDEILQYNVDIFPRDKA